jgi:hypothetical protein
MAHVRDAMRSNALDPSEQETSEGKSVRKPPGFAVTAALPALRPTQGGAGGDGSGDPKNKDGKPARLPAQQHAATPADATQAQVHGPTMVHPLVETEGVTITADNVAPADRKAWKYLGQEGISYYYFCEWKGMSYFITASSVNSGEDIYHYAEAKPDGQWKLFYPDMPPDFMGDLQRTVAQHYDMLEWSKFLVLETGLMLLCETVSLAGYAARVGAAWWRAGKAVGRRAGRVLGKQTGKKAAQETGEAVAEQAGQRAVAAIAKKEMRAFTKANCRHNLQVRTGEEGVGMDAHHVFPQAERFSEYFERTGINIHDPEYLRWWPSASHKKAAKAYNQAWSSYKVDKPLASKAEIEAFGENLMKKYGF